MTMPPLVVAFGAPSRGLSGTAVQGEIVREGPLSVVFSGRLDNRSELASLLSVPSGSDDARLAALSLQRWGRSAPARFLGDFAFVAWNETDGRVLLGRDHLGIRSLYFRREAERVITAGEIAPVVERLPDARVDEDTVAQFLTGELENGPRTLYQDVQRVPPGHVVTIDARGSRFHAYWTATPPRDIRYQTDREYEEHLRELLARSVACRTEPGATGIALSGGLDSSALALVAHRVLGGDHAAQPFSLVFPGCVEADEESFIDAVSARLGVPSVKVMPAPVDAATLAEWTARWRDVPPLPADAAALSLYREMATRGIRVAFTGAGGDYLFCGTAFHYADLLRRGAVTPLAKAWLANARVSGYARGLEALAAKGVWPALPERTKRVLRPLARRAWRRHQGRVPWLRVAAPAPRTSHEPRGGRFAVEALIRDLTSGMHSYFLQSASRAASTAGIQLRYPLLDVRLVEFCLAIPEDQRRREGVQKSLLRRALGRDYPPEIATRTTKADFSHVVLEAFASLGGSFFEHPELARRGWIDARAVQQMLQRMDARRRQGDEQYGNDVPSLWAVTALELWMRAHAETVRRAPIIGSLSGRPAHG